VPPALKGPADLGRNHHKYLAYPDDNSVRWLLAEMPDL
jgi:hypothetical protein